LVSTAETSSCGVTELSRLPARLYAEAARLASSLPEGDHLARQAARLNVELRG